MNRRKSYRSPFHRPIRVAFLAAIPFCLVSVTCHAAAIHWNFGILGEIALIFVFVLGLLVPFLKQLKANHEIQNTHLDQYFEQSQLRFKSMEQAAAFALNKISSVRESDKSIHIKRMHELIGLICTELSRSDEYSAYISPEYIQDLQIASTLHDIGNVGVSEEILQKSSPLNHTEFESVKMHTIVGGDMIAELQATLPNQTYFSLAQEVAYHHHQRWDGEGYPNVVKIGTKDVYFVQKGVGTPLSGTNIPLSARIVALVDVYETILSQRSYKEALSHRIAVSYIEEEKGGHFDPDIVEAFLRIEEQFYKIILNPQE